MTEGSFGDQSNSGDFDAYVAKVDASGTRQWVDLLGSPKYDVAVSLLVDGSGNIYAVGSTSGELEGKTQLGAFDVFIARYDASGNRKWLEIFGTSNGGDSLGDATISRGENIYVAGQTQADFGGRTHSGGWDGFVARFDTSGSRKWVELLGTAEREFVNDVDVDGNGSLHVVGETGGALGGGANSGGKDNFLWTGK